MIRNRRKEIAESGLSKEALFGVVARARAMHEHVSLQWRRSDGGGAEVVQAISLEGHHLVILRPRVRDGQGVPRKAGGRIIEIHTHPGGFRIRTECGNKAAKKLAKKLLEAVRLIVELEFLGMPEHAKALQSRLKLTRPSIEGLEGVISDFRPTFAGSTM